MAIEVRRIILERHEVQAVLNVYAQLEETSFPAGFVVGFDIEEKKTSDDFNEYPYERW
ncbi:MAG: hypothetical protein VB913_08235 [Rhodospirillales bacterium]